MPLARLEPIGFLPAFFDVELVRLLGSSDTPGLLDVGASVDKDEISSTKLFGGS